VTSPEGMRAPEETLSRQQDIFHDETGGMGMKVVGLTGGIATGKSTVATMFAGFGAHVISADVIAREVVEPGGRAYAGLREAFGGEYFDKEGRLYRKKMAAVIFADPSKRRLLEDLTHPHVIKEMQERISLAETRGHRVVIAEIPLLFESRPSRELVDITLAVYCSPAEQARRLRLREGITGEEVDRRLQAQMPIDEKVRRANIVINNSGPLTATRKSVRVIWYGLEEWPDEDCAHCP